MKYLYLTKKTILSIAVLALSGLCLGQDDSSQQRSFGLFEEVDQPANQSPARRQAATQNRRPPSSPDFILQGTSKIGSRQNVMLQHSSGENVLIRMDNRTNVAIPGYTKFRIVGMESGRVNIRLPADQDCVEFTGLGVGCNEDGDIAQLQLVNAAPVVRRGSTINTSDSESTNDSNTTEGSNVNSGNTEGEATSNENEGTQERQNPFAALRSGNTQQDSGNQDSALNRFTPRRIDPNEVPPGKRVVSTPFGDRLIDI